MAGAVFVEASSKVAGTFSSQNAGLVSGAAKALGIITNVNIQYQQSVSRIFDLNRTNKTLKSPMYYVGGRAQGNLTIGRLLGPKADCDFYTEYGNICKINEELNLTFEGGDPGTSAKAGCGKNKTKTYSIKQPVLTGIGISQNAQDFMVNENLTLMFADMECDGGAGGGGVQGGGGLLV